MILTVTSTGYVLTSIVQCLNLFGKLPFPMALLRFISLFILMGHGWLLYQMIEVHHGQNLDVWLMLSMTLWLMGLIIFLTFNDSLIKLNMLAYLLSGLSLPIVSFYHGVKVIETGGGLLAFHILISFMATSVLCLALMQAGLLSVQNRLLKKNARHSILTMLPPLNHMESLLFTIIGTGFALLTLSLFSGLFYFDHLFTGPMLPKTLLATLAWVMFFCMLWARFKKGLRGQSAIRLTLLSGGLLFFSYFGTQLIQ